MSADNIGDVAATGTYSAMSESGEQRVHVLMARQTFAQMSENRVEAADADGN